MNATRRYPEPIAASIAETAAMLGVSRWTVMRMCDAGTLASTKIGSRRKIPVAEVRRLLTQREAPTQKPRSDVA